MSGYFEGAIIDPKAKKQKDYFEYGVGQFRIDFDEIKDKFKDLTKDDIIVIAVDDKKEYMAKGWVFGIPEFINKIENEVGFKPKYEVIELDDSEDSYMETLYVYIKNKYFNFSLNNLTTRLNKLNFAKPYYNIGDILVVKKKDESDNYYADVIDSKDNLIKIAIYKNPKDIIVKGWTKNLKNTEFKEFEIKGKENFSKKSNFAKDMPDFGIIVKYKNGKWLSLDENDKPVLTNLPDEFVNNIYAQQAAEKLDPNMSNWSFETARFFSEKNFADKKVSVKKLLRDFLANCYGCTFNKPVPRELPELDNAYSIKLTIDEREFKKYLYDFVEDKFPNNKTVKLMYMPGKTYTVKIVNGSNKHPPISQDDIDDRLYDITSKLERIRLEPELCEKVMKELNIIWKLIKYI